MIMLCNRIYVKHERINARSDYNLMRRTIFIFRFTTHFQEHVFPDIPCMTCRTRQSTEHGKTAELGMDGLEGMSGTVRPGDASLLLSKQSKKTFLGASLEAQTKENSFEWIEKHKQRNSWAPFCHLLLGQWTTYLYL